MIDSALELLLQFIRGVLETVNQESFIFAIDLTNDMMPEVFNLMISQQIFKQFQPGKVKLFILLYTIVSHNFKVQIRNMVNDATSYIYH